MEQHHHNPFANKPAVLLLVLGVFFVSNAIVAEFIGVKVFSLEDTFGWKTFNWHLFGIDGSLQYTAGNVLWPFIFVMTDLLNEYFGSKGVRKLSYLAIIFISYAFLISYTAIHLAPASWWTGSFSGQGIDDAQAAYASIFGQGMWIIAGSIIAFFFSQLIDVIAFHRIKAVTGERSIWLRATGSTAISQVFDSLIVLYVAFVLGPQHWSINQWLAIALCNYIFKIFAAIALIPLLYLIHGWIEKYLGKELSDKMRNEAMKG